MPQSRRPWIALGALAAGLCLPAFLAMADGAGWSISSDPRKRVFLSYGTAKDGPRALLLACLRDVDTFTVASEGVAEASSNGKKAALVLVNGNARYAVDGEISNDPISKTASFSVDLDLNKQTTQQLRRELLPVLEGKGPIELTLGPAHRELGVSGLAPALKRFSTACFGGR